MSPRPNINYKTYSKSPINHNSNNIQYSNKSQIADHNDKKHNFVSSKYTMGSKTPVKINNSL